MSRCRCHGFHAGYPECGRLPRTPPLRSRPAPVPGIPVARFRHVDVVAEPDRPQATGGVIGSSGPARSPAGSAALSGPRQARSQPLEALRDTECPSVLVDKTPISISGELLAKL